MEARFPKVDDRRRCAQLIWSDGYTATLAQYQHFTPFPHDLMHYAVDAVLRPRYGFWELTAQKAPFSSLTPCRPWPLNRREWFAKVLVHHRNEMVEAEMLTGLLPSESDSGADGVARYMDGPADQPETGPDDRDL